MLWGSGAMCHGVTSIVFFAEKLPCKMRSGTAARHGWARLELSVQSTFLHGGLKGAAPARAHTQREDRERERESRKRCQLYLAFSVPSLYIPCFRFRVDTIRNFFDLAILDPSFENGVWQLEICLVSSIYRGYRRALSLSLSVGFSDGRDSDLVTLYISAGAVPLTSSSRSLNSCIRSLYASLTRALAVWEIWDGELLLLGS